MKIKFEADMVACTLESIIHYYQFKGYNHIIYIPYTKYIDNLSQINEIANMAVAKIKKKGYNIVCDDVNGRFILFDRENLR